MVDMKQNKHFSSTHRSCCQSTLYLQGDPRVDQTLQRKGQGYHQLSTLQTNELGLGAQVTNHMVDTLLEQFVLICKFIYHMLLYNLVC